jgi:Cytochrome c554 and c-prime
MTGRATRWRFLLLLAGACGGRGELPSSGQSALPLAAESCRPCHAAIVDSWAATAHARTSALADSQTVAGDFSEGHNALQTGAPNISFRMERRDSGFFQTAYDNAAMRSRTERFDLVIGSGKIGQTYLYWRDGLLFELPVSWLSGASRWINSPGYVDGRVDFERVVVPRCLECHATRFTIDTSLGAARARYGSDYLLGVSCSKCHGDGRAHVAWHAANPADTVARDIINPGRLSRERQLDNCGLCHGGARNPKRPAGTYQVGEPLDDWFHPAADRDAPRPDVHGNQVELMRRTACFRGSPAMTCASCHDPHVMERDLGVLAERCLACHAAAAHPDATGLGDRLRAECIDCHMPEVPTSALWVNTPTGRWSPNYRSHAIGIYPATSER